ncbi:Gfo/Idh/MocA family protein [Amaricoccus tamworthensis]|uniref:Gfo/Idh/MocA family protein n=1 Tax=Amaricoccus tamworthensis TaxID=57002 RepID=UPI003C7D33D2
MTDTLGVGVIGCGNISTAYFRLAPLFAGMEIRACTDLNMDAARAQAAKFDVDAREIGDLLKSDDIDVVVNLTIPDAHSAVSCQAIQAGKHVYSEKPLALTLRDGVEMQRLAREHGVSVGCAPDTFLGGAHQHARHLIDAGEIGRIVAGTAHVMSHGMEHWHPNPDFFFRVGGGPVLDIGPYYVANLINLIGPIKRVAALSSSATPTRTITSQPRAGDVIPVETPTNVHALLEFEQGATVTLSTSWDVWAHDHGRMELYGTEGSLFVPDPNFFGGDLRMAKRDAGVMPVTGWHHPLSVPNDPHGEGMMANYRTVGLADMVAAIRDGRDARCSIDRTLHALDAMASILMSGETGQFVDLTTTCSRPEPLDPASASALMR